MASVERELSAEDIDDIKYLFDYVDHDKDGQISFDEFKQILIEAEVDIDFDTLYTLIDVINPGKKEFYDFEMIKHFFRIRPEDPSTEEEA